MAEAPASSTAPASAPAEQMQAQQAHLAYMQQYQQAQLRQQVAYMQQAMMAFPGNPYPSPGYPGATPYMGGMPQAMGGKDFGGKGKGFGGKGFGNRGDFGKGGFGKGGGGKGKGKKGKSKGEDGEAAEGGEAGEGGEETERPPRPRRDEPPIVKAQREARERAEGSILKLLQGRWTDEADKDISYTVEGNTVSVANKNGGRTFHNRLSMYGVEFCWNAKRFWHDVNLKELQSSGDEPEKVEWNPGKSSPAAEQITWLRAPPEPEKPEEPEKEDATDGAEKPSGDCSGPAAETTEIADP